MAFLNIAVATVVGLLPIANPFSTAALILGITRGDSPEERHRQALMGCVYMLGILTVFLLLGTLICWVSVRASTSIVKFLGSNGLDALGRIMGFLLLCVGVQFIVNGVIDIVTQEEFLRRISEVYHDAPS